MHSTTQLHFSDRVRYSVDRNDGQHPENKSQVVIKLFVKFDGESRRTILSEVDKLAWRDLSPDPHSS